MSESHDATRPVENPDVRFEASDVDSSAVLKFGIALAVSLAVMMGILWGLFVLFYDQEAALKQSGYPLADQRRRSTSENERLPATGPRIEGFPLGNPQHTLGRFGPPSGQQKNDADERHLAAFGWIGDNHAFAHIPIAEAMKRVLATLPIAKDAPPPGAEAGGAPSVSSSGRMPIGGRP